MSGMEAAPETIDGLQDASQLPEVDTDEEQIMQRWSWTLSDLGIATSLH
jgi:hypothetical protein